MPTSAWPRRPEAGFTLMEMLVVLTILGIAAALVAGRIGDGPGRFARDRQVAELKARIATARSEARRRGEAVQVAPASVVEGATIEHPAFGDGRALTFYPDGSASGGTITVAARAELEVDWLTGEVRDAD